MLHHLRRSHRTPALSWPSHRTPACSSPWGRWSGPEEGSTHEAGQPVKAGGRGWFRLLLLAALATLAACSDGGPTYDPPSDMDMLGDLPSLSYPEETHEVGVRIVTSSGEPAVGYPVTWTGDGAFEGPVDTGSDGAVRGVWTPDPGGDGLGTARITARSEAGSLSFTTEVVTQGVAHLTFAEAPDAYVAGDTAKWRISIQDGKSLPVASGDPFPGRLQFLVDGQERGDAPAVGEEVLFATADTVAGVQVIRVELVEAPSEGPRRPVATAAEAQVEVLHGDPAAVAVEDEAAVRGREGDFTVAPPTLRVRDRFGNPVQGHHEVAVGGGGEAFPALLSFPASGHATLDSLRFGSGEDAGTITVTREGRGASIQFPVAPHVEPEAFALTGLPSPAFQGEEVTVQFTVTGAGGAAAYAPYEVRLEPRAQGLRIGEAGDGVVLASGRLDGDGSSGTLRFEDLPLGEWVFRVVVDTAVFDEVLDVLEPPVPSEIILLGGQDQEGFVGSVLAPLRARIVDQRGDGISVPISWRVTGGDVDSPSRTDLDGEVRAQWRLPAETGSHEAILEVGVAGVALTFTFRAVALELPVVTQISAVSGSGQSGLIAQALGDPLVVQLRDQYGNPISAPVSFSGPGTFAPESGTSGVNGRFQTVWTLPSSPGEHEATATAGEVSVSFTAEAEEAPFPSQVQRVSGDGQVGAAGAALTSPLVVEVRDQNGNPISAPVSFSGPGTFAPESGTSGANGRFQTVWTLPSSPGEYEATATAGDASVSFTAEAEPPPPSLPVEIDGHYIVQVTQSEDQGVDLVEGRSATFRAFLRRTEAGAVTVRLVVRNGAAVVKDVPLTINSPIPTDTPDRASQATTFQTTISGSHIQGGMSYTLHVESDEVSAEVTRTPRVIQRDPLFVRFIPIRVDTTGLVGDVNPGNVDDFMGLWEGLPFPSADASVEDVYTYFGDAPTADGDAGWTPLIQEVLQLWDTQAYGDGLYYGVFEYDSFGGGVAGMGYIGLPVSLAASNFSPATNRYIFNHEVGHNLNQRHAPCGGAGGADPNFPNPQGHIGVFGFFQGQVQDPSTPDVMGYCNGIFMGPYMWNRAIAYPTTSWASPVARLGGRDEPALRVWGRVEEGRVTLRAPYVARLGRSTPASAGGGLAITLRGLDGRTLWSGTAPLRELDHSPTLTFSLGIPLAEIGGVEGAVLEVEAPEGLRRFAVGMVPEGFGMEGREVERLPPMEIYRTEEGGIRGFGVPGVSTPPPGLLIQDAGLGGELFRQRPDGERGEQIGRMDTLLRGEGPP